MKRTQNLFALALGSVLALSLLSGCGGKAETPSVKRICFDNLPDDAITIPVEDTQCVIDKVASYVEYDAEGKEAEKGTVVSYEGGTFTAKSAGTVVATLSNKKKARVEVVPAYATDPKNQYQAGVTDVGRDSSTLLGSCHDPSLIEVMEEDGTPTYYIFSTGWSDGSNGFGNDIRKSKDLIHWEFVGKPFSRNTLDSMMTGDVGKWLYDGKVNESDSWYPNYHGSRPDRSSGSTMPYWASWWAPDIVPAAGGGYWLYTCVVDGGPAADAGGTGVPIGNEGAFTRACIILCYSKTLEPQSFEYKGVLMQSSIPFKGADQDVNAIDPQIIYTPDGKMYMAYGSFGTGNYILELDPKTGLRKDGVKDWKTHDFVRDAVADVSRMFGSYKDEDGNAVGWTHDYYGKNISKKNMEAPVIARHDNVTVSDETGKVLQENKTFYYSMHSYNGLDQAYQMWGGRSESPTGPYLNVYGNGIVYNMSPGNTANQGNKYMGAFTWANKTGFNIDIVLPGHNDLFTTNGGVNVAAYITRTESFREGILDFVTQIHQYYLNSYGDICINPNRYGGESGRAVSEEELFTYTDGGKFKMICLSNDNDPKLSADVVLDRATHKISYSGTEIGNWVMYGDGYIKFEFTNTDALPALKVTGETVYYGVVRTAWLDDQNCSGFTITSMGHTGKTRNFAMFMNNYSTVPVK